ncbi:catalytic activity protein [[Candida] boidinii]|uniref:Unnamed protein product n=1 Tax=Candida boidinii TaxID=5477 RepID=A0ACB5TIQ5_CANBO|nr:catalytic activity protein [[Candida] boidinii]OWB60458.1 catalytic activity protein [[Candida] boidinii]GME89249.1 unnamed protein product [[Candida] boidinii]
MTKLSWTEISKNKQESLIQLIPEEWRNPSIKEEMINAGFSNTYDYLNTILPKEEVEITSLTMLELISKIANKTFTSLQVAKAYCHRAALAHQILNCCVEIFFDLAFEDAKRLDEYLAVNGKVAGPLHGIPISLKDQVDLPGFASSIGYVSLSEEKKTKMSLMAIKLKEMGAVFYVKTTVPTAMMANETDSNLVGYTYNSKNINLSSGGSSGGEGSLVGAGASVMGFGTDIGGSIRFPSAFQGLYALKPSTGRISYMDVTNSYCNQESIPSVIGPMARSLEDVQYITKLLVGSECWDIDPKVLPVPWKDLSSLKTEKLTIGLWKDDGLLQLHPPVKRAVEELGEKLKKAGHEVVVVQFPFQQKLIQTLFEVYTADAAKEIIDECARSGEPIVSSVEDLMIATKDKEILSSEEWWNLCGRVYKLKQEFFNYWNVETKKLTKDNKAIDCIVGPVYSSTAFPRKSRNILNYTGPYNLCDCSCVVLPISKVDASIDKVDDDFQARSDDDQFVHDYYDPKLFDKMPICVQIVTKKLEEEKGLAIASTIEELL